MEFSASSCTTSTDRLDMEWELISSTPVVQRWLPADEPPEEDEVLSGIESASSDDDDDNDNDNNDDTKEETSSTFENQTLTQDKKHNVRKATTPEEALHQVHEILSTYELLPRSEDSLKKLSDLEARTMEIASMFRFTPVDRHFMLKEMMIMMKNTFLEENTKKLIVQEIMFILLNSMVTDAKWHERCKLWVREELPSVMSFLYEFQPKLFRPGNLTTMWWKSRHRI